MRHSMEDQQVAHLEEGRKRRRSAFTDNDADQDFHARGGRSRHYSKLSASNFFDEEAVVVSDEEEEEEEAQDDFIVEDGADLPEEDDSGMMRNRRMLPHCQEDDEDLEAVARSIQERYGRRQRNYDEETRDVEQQALLPSVRDPKLWMVKCAIGRERETAVCLMQKYTDRGSQLQIRSAIALDHLKNYIYVEAYKEAHVREACKGLNNIFGKKITLVPIREMTDVLYVESKEIDLARGSWIRMKTGTYKGDLGKVVDVDSVQQRVMVKLIPRIDLHALANKLEGREVVKKKAFVCPPRFMNLDEATKLHIRVEHRRDAYGVRFDRIQGMMFKDGFLYKSVSIKSVSTQNIKPTFDELDKFRKSGKDGRQTLSTNRKKGHFMKGHTIIVVKGDLKNLKGKVDKVDEDHVYITPEIEGLPVRRISVNSGNHVKVVSGAEEGANGMVVKVEHHVLILISDTTKEHIRVFADDVVESSEVDGHDLEHAGFICGGGRHRGHEGLAGRSVKVGEGPYKGYRGRVIEDKGTSVRVELESQMKVVTVDRNHICENVARIPYGDTSRYGMGSETPLHPSRTPMRDPGGLFDFSL